jgi:thiol-disulfide isomerase/thioredoxin
MKHSSIILLALVFVHTSCGRQDHDRAARGLVPMESIKSQGISLGVYDFQGIKPLFEPANDTLYIINFWATWCKPCVQELPYFERIGKEYEDRQLKVVLVSLDFRPQIEGQLIPFMIKNKLRSEVLVLHDPDANAWIEQVDPAWTGAIPATLFIRNTEKSFYEKSFTYDELKQIVESKL